MPVMVSGRGLVGVAFCPGFKPGKVGNYVIKLSVSIIGQGIILVVK